MLFIAQSYAFGFILYLKYVACLSIHSLQDIKELNLTDNPEWKGERRNTKGD